LVENLNGLHRWASATIGVVFFGYFFVEVRPCFEVDWIGWRLGVTVGPVLPRWSPPLDRNHRIDCFGPFGKFWVYLSSALGPFEGPFRGLMAALKFIQLYCFKIF
jgi:hypothetical protein